MRNRYFSLMLLCFMSLYGVAQTAKKQLAVPDSAATDIEILNYYLDNPNWTPVDSATYNKVKLLVAHMKNPSIEGVSSDLKGMTSQNMIFFNHRSKSSHDGDNVPGYIKQSVMTKQLLRIEQRADDLYPAGETPVPESIFMGMYTALPLVSTGDEDRFLLEDLVPISDTLKNKYLSIAPDDTSAVVIEKRQYLDSLRRSYNNQLVEHFRDSISTIYRDALRNNYADSVKRVFMDSVSMVNQLALKQYGDSVVLHENERIRHAIDGLIQQFDMQPNTITFHGIYDDEESIDLVNAPGSYKWLWLKNHRKDSIGIKLETIDKHNLLASVDERINFSRMEERERVEVKKLSPTVLPDGGLSKVTIQTPEKSPWTLGGKTYSGITQTYINDYWSKGGQSSSSVIMTLDYAANYAKNKFKWENSADFKLGFINYKTDEKVDHRWHKNSDNIKLISRFGLSAFKKWYYSGEVEFTSQFFNGYKNASDTILRSAFLSPGYLSMSLGMDYKPSNVFSAFISPLSLKNTYVINPNVDRATYGLEPGENLKTRVGATAKINFNKKLMENVNIKTNNTIFVNFKSEYIFKVPDFENETVLSFKVNQYITTQVNLNMIYDKDVTSTWTDDAGVEQKGTRLQIKEFVTFGFSYKL